MKNQTTSIIAIIFIAIVVVPSAFLAVMGAFEDLLNSILKFFGSTPMSQAGVGWYVEYQDGTKQEFNPNQTIGLTVLHEGKAVRYWGLTAWYKLDYTQEPSSVLGSVSTDTYFDDVLHYQHSWDIQPQAPPPQGEWTRILGGGISFGAKELEDWDQGKNERHIIKCSVTVLLTITFHEGEPVSLEGTAQGSITLDVTESATMTVEVRPTSIYLSTV